VFLWWGWPELKLYRGRKGSGLKDIRRFEAASGGSGLSINNNAPGISKLKIFFQITFPNPIPSKCTSMAASPFEFPVLTDTHPDDHSLPAFMVSTTRGFLPRQEPISKLPEEFAAAESILNRMPVKTLSGEPGLLANFTLGKTVLEELPDLTHAVEKYRYDLVVMNALYRDYSFLASAYLLEPCHERFLKGEPYGLGRQSLPRCIAMPIVKIAEM
jgi:hypothetical protein